MNDDDDLNLHSMTKLSGWLRLTSLEHTSKARQNLKTLFALVRQENNVFVLESCGKIRNIWKHSFIHESKFHFRNNVSPVEQTGKN